jgi:hypothetical protein
LSDRLKNYLGMAWVIELSGQLFVIKRMLFHFLKKKIDVDFVGSHLVNRVMD